MDALEVLRGHALLGIPAGMTLGLLLGLVAAREEGWGGYAHLRRRAARLGHVAAVLLPVLSGLYALLGATWAVPAGALLDVATALWVGGSVLLPAALFFVAWRPGALLVLPLPATTVVAAASLMAAALLQGGNPS